jgi:chromosome segregation ATPase
MNLDEIPERLEELFDRSRAALDAQITKARKAVDSLNAEKAATTKSLAELQDQHSKVKAELETTLANLDRASSLRGLDSEIKKSRKELEQLNAETAKETKALEALVKKRKETEVHVVALEERARAATAERCRAQDMLQEVKAKVAMVIG